MKLEQKGSGVQPCHIRQAMLSPNITIITWSSPNITIITRRKANKSIYLHFHGQLYVSGLATVQVLGKPENLARLRLFAIRQGPDLLAVTVHDYSIPTLIREILLRSVS
jgi:hypothetical protein